jgi:hypothetical protein
MSRVRKALIVATVGIAGAIAVPTAASAGIYTWKYVGSYSSLAACQSAGPGVAAQQDADTWRCSSTTSGANLYLGYIW